MSAPPLATHPTMPTVVSRLPKFGPRGKAAPDGAQLGPSAAGPSARLTNGFYHHPGPAGVNSSSAAPVRQNGFIRVPTSFSMKWRKENGTMEGGGTDGEKDWKRGNGGNVGQNRSSNNISQQASPGQSQHDARKPTASSMGKGRGVGQPVTPSSSPSPQSSPRTLPVPKASQCGLSNGTKQALNGLPGSKARSGASSSLRQPQAFAFSGSRPGSGSGFGFRSGSPLQKKPPATRSQSTDSLGGSAAVQLTDGDRFRSRSLTQVRQQPSPTLTPSRSGSNVRAAEKGVRERSASSPQAPHRGSLAKSPVSRALEGGAKGGEVKGHSSGASGGSGGGLTSVLPPSALKKPLLPSLAPTSKPSGVSYKLSRPSLVKQSRPLRVTSANGPGPDPEGCRNSAETPSTSPDSSPEAPGSEGAEPLSYAEVTLEDMSLSSTSSLDRNDTSQEYMDDFDNLGNGGVGVLLSPKNDEDDSGLDQSCGRFDDDFMSINAVSKTTGLCFLEDGVDWAGMRLCGERAAPGFARFSHQRRPSQADCHDQGGSSLDLSPSDSCGSGGTYLWDEEGLEPLGGTSASINTTHHVGSFDSDLNSVDILNNLDSCDLEDDDLMLDADLAEDGSLHSDGDGMSHMAQWRRRQLCWGMQDAHNNDGDLQCYQLTEDPGNQRTAQDSGLVLALCPPRSPSLSPATPGLGLDVEELAEDCSSVRSQLEFLQRLLLQEDEVDDDTLTTDTVSPDTESSHSSDSQVQALLQEVQQLREELRSRDRTIAQLTLNLAVPTATTRCCCQETTRRMDQYTQTSVTERESVASQTPWSDHNAFPPAPFLSPPWQYQRSRPYRGRPRPSIPSHLARKRVEKLVLYFSDTACHRYFTPPSNATRNH